jgi:DNA-3-methyladenine glycosylase II
MSADPLAYVPQALRHLRRRDPSLKPILKTVGPFTLKVHDDRFRLLTMSIISQQISTKAAEAISGRLMRLIKPRRLGPATILKLSDAQMRQVGLSPQKMRYLKHLAELVGDRVVDLKRMHEHDDEAVIEQLTQVKGIGRWTAEMFLIFALGRPDVLPVDDFGLKLAIKLHHQLEELPTRAEVRKLAVAWTPYSTVGTWYCWQWLGKLRAAEKK